MRTGPAARGVSARVVALLAAAAFINYVDRGMLATAGPLIRDEFALSNVQLGLLLSAFFWSYSPGQLPAGVLAERFDARRVLAAGLALWGAATVLSGMASGFLVLLVLRVVLGVGESVMYPASFKILALEASDTQRGRANGFLASGLSLGSAFGTLVGALLMAHIGWRVVFVAAGGASLQWLWPWLRTPAAPRLPVSASAQPGPPTLVLLRSRELWGSCVGHFCGAYVLYLVLSWLPLYLVKARGFSMAQMAPLGAAVYALAGLSSVVAGWIADRVLARGADGNRVRKTTMLVAFLGQATCLGICAVADRAGALLAMAGCGVCLGVFVTGIYVCAQALAGAGAAARWMGVQNFCGNLAGVTAPLVTGIVIDRTGGFAAAFAIAAALALIGAAAFALVVRRIAPIDWRARLPGRLQPAMPSAG